LSRYFSIPAELVADFRFAIRAIGAVAAVNFVGNVFSAITLAHERFVRQNIVQIASEIAKFAATVGFLYAGLGLRGLGLAMLLGVGLRALLSFVVCRNVAPQATFHIKYANRHTLATLSSFSLFVFLTAFGDVLRFQVDTVVVGRALSLTEVGIYGIAVSILRYATRLSNAGVVVLMPRLTRLHSQNDPPRFRTMFRRYSNLMGVLSFGIAVIVASLGGPFIELWVGAEFAPAETVLLILLAAAVPDYATSASIYALQAVNKHRYYAYNSVVEGAANLALSILLVRWLGMTGVALGTLIPALVTKLVVQPLYTVQTIGVSLRAYLTDSLIRPFGPGVGTCAIALLVRTQIILSSLGRLAAFGLAVLVAYCTLSLFFGLSPDNRQKAFLRVQSALTVH
jgi:O-antigen/teichoic acid export membrane protein